jgi:putative membrane protein
MERQKSLKNNIVIALIVLFHAVGLAGFLIPAYSSLFLILVPYHLLLMLCLIFYSYGRVSFRMAVFFGIIWCLGFSAEYLGVHKGWLFGNYMYGHTLGRTLLGVPLIIGANWFLLVFSTGALMQKVKIRKRVIRILVGAAILTLLDILIEPVAVKLDYWQWINGTGPLKNYICWFLISVLMLWIFERFRFRRLNWAGPILLIMQFVFFAVLYWTV